MEESIGESLQAIRKRLGFLSARSFYMDLHKRAELSFNYSYYMKIEADQLVPSEKVINQIAQLLPGDNGDELVKAYCSSLFPEQMKRLLKNNQSSENLVEKKSTKTKKKYHLRSHQMELNEKQIAIIAKTPTHYYLFLILTLARKGIKKIDLKKYNLQDIGEALSDIQNVKLIYSEGEEFYPSYPEYVFPAPESQSLKKLYQKLNEYDVNRNQTFGLTKKKKASFFKRISPRQAEIILLHLELLFQTIRTADEQDVSYNDEVISFELSYFQGKLVG